MGASVLAPLTPAHSARPRPPGRPLALADLQQVLRSVGEVVNDVPPDDPRWDVVGPLVTAVADRARNAVGLSTTPTAFTPAPIARQRDLSVAGRRLGAMRARLVDEDAADDVVTLSSHVSMALR